MDRIYKYEITAKSIFEIWAIRTYLHRRLYNVLYSITKLVPILLLINGELNTTFEIIYNIFLFFYFELYMLYKYINII